MSASPVTPVVPTTDPAPAKEPLRAAMSVHRHIVVLHGYGIVGHRSLGSWRTNLDSVVNVVHGRGEIIVDLAKVRFSGDSGVRVLADAFSRCADSGRRLSVADSNPGIVDSLRDRFACRSLIAYPDVATALDRIQRRAHRAVAPAQPIDYEHLEPLFRRLRACHDPVEKSLLRDNIIQTGMPLAEHIAARFGNRGEPREDLLQVARLGLVQAVNRFDVSRSRNFLSFAIPTIMGEVRRHFRDHTWAVRVPRPVQENLLQIRPVMQELAQTLGRTPTPREVADRCDIEYNMVIDAMLAGNAYHTASIDTTARDDDSVVRSDTIGEVDPGYVHVDRYLTVKPLLERLPERERRVLIMRFFEEMTQAQIAARIGVSQMQVSRILNATLERLRVLGSAD